MKKLSKLLTVCAVLVLAALLILATPFQAHATKPAIPTQTPHLRTDVCPCKFCNGKPYNGVWTEITAATKK